MSMFGTTAEENYDGLSIPSLAPGKYEGCTLEDIKAESLVKATGEIGKFAIKFFFKTADGSMHQHTEYELKADEKDAEKKSKNLTKRVGHIMSKFVPKDRLSQNSGSFVEYANWVVATLKSVQFKDVKVDILVVGNVWNGKATAGFSGYPPFIAVSGESLQFDTTATAANKAYEAHMAKQTGAQPDQESGASNPAGINNAPGPKPDF